MKIHKYVKPQTFNNQPGKWDPVINEYTVKHAWSLVNNYLTIIERDIITNVRDNGNSKEQLYVLEAYISLKPNIGEESDKGKNVIDDFLTDDIF